jgi:3',5'-cyclic-AMP phosphodiesterase
LAILALLDALHSERALPAGNIRAMNADVRLLLFSDPHLFANTQASLRGVQTLASLQRVLDQASREASEADALVCCGDIVNDEPEGYAHFAHALERCGKPVYCIPGNHDDPALLRAALARPPFQVGGHVDMSNWRIVLVDSCVPGQARGSVSASELEALEQALGSSERHALVCLHHHPVSMSSRWLDAIGIDNADQLLRVIDAHRNVRVLAWGHVHQYFDSQRRGVRLLATPSTGAQFLPRSEHFAVDNRPPAYRRLCLHPDGTIDTEVVWVQQAVGAAAA